MATDQYLTVVPIDKEIRNNEELINKKANNNTKNNILSYNSTTFIQFRSIPSQPETENPTYILVPKRSEDPCRDEDILFMLDPCTKVQTVKIYIFLNSF